MKFRPWLFALLAIGGGVYFLPVIGVSEVARIPRGGHLGGSRAAMEVLTYEMSWNGLAAARADVVIKRDALANKPVIRLTAHAHTVGNARNILRVDDRMEVLLDRDSLKPIKIEQNRNEAASKKGISSMFLPDRASENPSEPSKQGASAGKPKGYLPISFILLARCIVFHVGDEISLDMVINQKTYNVVMKVAMKEKVSVKAGSFDAHKILPVFYQYTSSGKRPAKNLKAGNIAVWVSAGDAPDMVKFKTRSAIGNVQGELVSIKKQ